MLDPVILDTQAFPELQQQIAGHGFGHDQPGYDPALQHFAGAYLGQLFPRDYADIIGSVHDFDGKASQKRARHYDGFRQGHFVAHEVRQ